MRAPWRTAREAAPASAAPVGLPLCPAWWCESFLITSSLGDSASLSFLSIACPTGPWWLCPCALWAADADPAIMRTGPRERL